MARASFLEVPLPMSHGCSAGSTVLACKVQFEMQEQHSFTSFSFSWKIGFRQIACLREIDTFLYLS